MLIAGSANGFMELEDVIRSGYESAKQALDRLNVKSKKIDLPKTQGDEELAIEPFWMGTRHF